MDIYDSVVSPSSVLNEQVARQVFDILPEDGPVMVIMDREKNYWPNDTERFSQLNASASFLQDLCAKIDDGAEPVVTQINDCSIIATHLATEQTHCGYVMIALSQYSPESTLANIDLIEILLNQVNLIAKLIEKNNHLYELQTKQLSQYSQTEVASN